MARTWLGSSAQESRATLVKPAQPGTLVTEDIQDGCLQRLTARARFNEGLPRPPQELAAKVVQQFHNEHAERYLLAFVYGYLGDPDLMAVRNDAEKYLMLGALNLVDCVACVGADKPSR